MGRGSKEDSCCSNRLVRSNKRLDRSTGSGNQRQGTGFCGTAEAEAAGFDSS